MKNIKHSVCRGIKYDIDHHSWIAITGTIGDNNPYRYNLWCSMWLGMEFIDRDVVAKINTAWRI
jgi:hypothetical protein